MNERYKALQAAVILVAVMIITGCDNPQRSAGEPQWEEEELYEIVKQRNIEFTTSLNHIMELWQANRFISAKKLEDEVLDKAGKLASATPNISHLLPAIQTLRRSGEHPRKLDESR